MLLTLFSGRGDSRAGTAKLLAASGDACIAFMSIF
jgi:hypothetical protein